MIFRDFFIKSSWLKMISVLLIISSEASAESKTIYIDSNATMNLNSQDLTKLLTQDSNNISKNPNAKLAATPLPIPVSPERKISIPVPLKQEAVQQPKPQEEKEIDITKATSPVSTSNIAIPVPLKQEAVQQPKPQEEKAQTHKKTAPTPQHHTNHKTENKKHDVHHAQKVKQDDAIEEEIIIEEMMLDSDLYNRPIYDHNTVILPPQISKKQYSESNKHLPKVFYQKEYTDLLFSSVKSDDIQGIKSLVQKGANINAQEVSTGYTPVMYAIKLNKIKALRALIMHGADLQKTNFDGQTALHVATLLGNAQAVEVLLSAGIDPTIRDKKGNRASEYMKSHMKKTATVMAANYQDINKALIDFVGLSAYGAVQYALQNGANVNIKDDVGADGDTPLIIAIKCQDIKMISLLLNHGASLNTKNNKNKTPIQVAKDVKNPEVIGILRTVKINREIELAEKK